MVSFIINNNNNNAILKQNLNSTLKKCTAKIIMRYSNTKKRNTIDSLLKYIFKKQTNKNMATYTLARADYIPTVTKKCLLQSEINWLESQVQLQVRLVSWKWP